MASKLTPKQQRFIDEYLVDLNATQAAIRSGYSEKNASRIAAELLNKTQVSEYLQKQREKLQIKLEVTQERVIQEIASIAFANGSDFVKIIIDGTFARAKMIPTDEIPKEKLPAIAGIKENQYGIEVKLHDKVKALELLGKYLGVFDRNGMQAQSENNLFEAINSCGEVKFDDLPELQQTAESDDAMVEDEEIQR